MSPAFGADDYAAGQRHNLAFLQPVGARGEFPSSMPIVGGLFVKDADALLIEELKRRGVLWKAGRLMHEYPHCWRCGTPLIYYARTSWFVRTTAFRDAMLARNARVDWHPPSVGEGRFGEWLDEQHRLGDFARPLLGHAAAGLDLRRRRRACRVRRLVRRAGRALRRAAAARFRSAQAERRPLHVAVLARRMRRDHAPRARSHRHLVRLGSMSFAQWHYPFENRDKIAEQFPADFIAEGVDQTRGWFYSLLAIATGLGDALPNNGGLGAERIRSAETPRRRRIARSS